MKWVENPRSKKDLDDHYDWSLIVYGEEIARFEAVYYVSDGKLNSSLRTWSGNESFSDEVIWEMIQNEDFRTQQVSFKYRIRMNNLFSDLNSSLKSLKRDWRGINATVPEFSMKDICFEFSQFLSKKEIEDFIVELDRRLENEI